MFKKITAATIGVLMLVPAAYASSAPAYVQSDVQGQLGAQLFDPYSARYTFDYHWGPSPTGKFIICGSVNAKNRFGAYAGRQMFFGTYDPRGSVDVRLISRGMEALYLDMCRDRN